MTEMHEDIMMTDVLLWRMGISQVSPLALGLTLEEVNEGVQNIMKQDCDLEGEHTYTFLGQPWIFLKNTPVLSLLLQPAKPENGDKR